MTVKIRLRRGTAAQWTSANPVLAPGEAGYETDTGKIKYGNGTDAWTALAYFLGNVDNTADANKNVLSAVNATNATKLATARTINGVSFDGTDNITVPAIQRSVQSISTATTLGAAANTDYVVIAQASTNAVSPVNLVGTTTHSAAHGGGPSSFTTAFTHNTATATLLIVSVYLYQGYSVPSLVTVSNNGTAMTEITNSKTNGPNFGPGSAGSLIQTFATVGSISGTNNLSVYCQGSTGNYMDVRCIAATYNLATSVGTVSKQDYTASASVTANNISNFAVFSANTAITSGATAVTSVGSGGGAFFMAQSIVTSPATLSNKTVTATSGAALSVVPIFNINGAPNITLPTAVGNTNRYTIKNTAVGYDCGIVTTSSQTIDGSSNYSLAQNDSIDLISDSTNWRIV